MKDLLAAGAEVDKALNNGSITLVSAARRGYEVIVNALHGGACMALNSSAYSRVPMWSPGSCIDYIFVVNQLV